MQNIPDFVFWWIIPRNPKCSLNYLKTILKTFESSYTIKKTEKKPHLHFSCATPFVLQWKEHPYCSWELNAKIAQYNKLHTENNPGRGGWLWESGPQTEGLYERYNHHEQDLWVSRIWVRYWNTLKMTASSCDWMIVLDMMWFQHSVVNIIRPLSRSEGLTLPQRTFSFKLSVGTSF